jgi:hypothetical protein
VSGKVDRACCVGNQVKTNELTNFVMDLEEAGDGRPETRGKKSLWNRLELFRDCERGSIS